MKGGLGPLFLLGKCNVGRGGIIVKGPVRLDLTGPT